MRVSTLFGVSRLSVMVLTLGCGAAPALARWSADPLTITATTATIPVVEACSDGAHGTFVVWQEGSPTGILRAQHLLPTGDLDPAWPAAGVVACNVATTRSEVTTLPDRLGGFYLMWKENTTLYSKRLDATGNTAAGWPARGRSHGAVLADSPRPVMIEDGAHGFYAVWTNNLGVAHAVRLGPANTGAGGWPNGPRAISSPDDFNLTAYWPQIALAPDGGVYVAWASATVDEVNSPSSWRLRRFAPGGQNAAGWTDEGLSFGSFHREFLGRTAKGSLIAVSADNAGGAFLMIGNPTANQGYAAPLDNRLYRLQGDGQVAPGWPPDGKVVGLAPATYDSDVNGSSPDHSYMLLPDHSDGAFLGLPAYYSELSYDYGLAKYQDQGWSAQGAIGGQELADNGGGGFFMASFSPTTVPYYYGAIAFIGISQTPTTSGWKDWTEAHPLEYGTWYGDIGLAPTGDGGAVLVWSQAMDRIGLFARRFNSAGQVTAVETAQSDVLAMNHLRFVRGEGVRAVISVAAGSARFELFDIAGRRLASRAVEPGAREVTLEGTSALPSGLYFGRLMASAKTVAGKVVVTR